MRARRAVVGAAFVSGVGALYVLEKAIARRWHAPEDELASAGLSMPSDVQHHFVTTTDGGRIHVVEAGQGPPIVLVHGITLGVGIWVRQFRGLAGTHRVIAIDQRGHGQSIAGTDGYRFERLADDLIEVLVRDPGSRCRGHREILGVVEELLNVGNDLIALFSLRLFPQQHELRDSLIDVGTS